MARAADALTHGYTVAFAAAAAMFLAGLLVTAPAVTAPRQHAEDGAPAVHLG
ncbi:hypothetical protein ABZX77_26980 [Streptomyces sp. NPDC004237]|uniref:hypothetical protein n=1 Tax=Streptomyces sp. NPDC004237 TaxID=3154455 RepID=UPI0033B6ED28